MTKQNVLNEMRQEYKAEREHLAQEKRQQKAEYKEKIKQLFQGYDALLLHPDDVYRMSVVGELKAGKSTFLNAILGDNVLHSKSSAATAFPLRIVHKTDIQGISLKYYTNDTVLENFKNNLPASMSSNDVKLITRFLAKLNHNQGNLTSEKAFKQMELLNNILRIVDSYEDNKVAEFLTCIVPEITVNFETFALQGHLELIENTVLIDTPGLGEDGALNKLFEYLIKYISEAVDGNALVLEKGGRNTKSEDNVTKMLSKAKSFYVIAGKLDEYNEDITDLLHNRIASRYNGMRGFDGVYGVSQHKFLIGIKVLKDFKAHGKIIDTREPYIADLIQEVYDRDKLKQYRNQDAGYEKLLQVNDDYLSLINDEYLNGQDQEFNMFLRDLNRKIYYEANMASSFENASESEFLELLKDPHLKYSIKKVIASSPNATQTVLKKILSLEDLKLLHLVLENENLDIDYFIDFLKNNPTTVGNHDVICLCFIGSLYEIGNSVDMDMDQAIEWYKKGVELVGEAQAFCEIGKIYAKGMRAIPDYDKAMYWCTSSANLNNIEAMRTIIELYKNGHGENPDNESVMEWHKKIATMTNDAHYMCWISYSYDKGYEVKPDMIQSMKWYRQALEIVNPAEAMFQMGLICEQDTDGIQDYPKAMEWYVKSANLKNTKAMKNIARLYKEGLGVPQDLSKAQQWEQQATK